MQVPDGDALRPLNGKRVLVVEDDFIILKDLEWILRQAGAEIASLCRTVDDALAHAKTDDIAVALLDVRVGQDDVSPLVRTLAQRRTPLVFYTGQAVSDFLKPEWPASRIVSKPASPAREVVSLTKQATGCEARLQRPAKAAPIACARTAAENGLTR